MELSTTDFLERIKSITPLKTLENDLQFSQSTISSWKVRNVFPKADDLYKIANYLHVSMDWLLTGTDPKIELPDNEKTLLTNYRKLNPDRKRMIDITIAALTDNK